MKPALHALSALCILALSGVAYGQRVELRDAPTVVPRWFTPAEATTLTAEHDRLVAEKQAILALQREYLQGIAQGVSEDDLPKFQKMKADALQRGLKYRTDVNRFAGDLSSKIGQRIDDWEQRRQRTRAALERAAQHLPDTQRAMRDWAELDQAAQGDAAWAGLRSFMSQYLVVKRMPIRTGLEATKGKLDSLEGLARTKQTSKMLKTMKRNNPALYETFAKELAETKGRLAEVKSADDLLKALDQFNTKVSVAEKLTQHTWWERAAVVADIARLFVKDPFLNLVLSDAEWAVAIGYANRANRIAAEEIDRLTTLQEDQLKEIGNYSRVMVQQTQELKAMRAAQKALAVYR